MKIKIIIFIDTLIQFLYNQSYIDPFIFEIIMSKKIERRTIPEILRNISYKFRETIHAQIKSKHTPTEIQGKQTEKIKINKG